MLAAAVLLVSVKVMLATSDHDCSDSLACSRCSALKLLKPLMLMLDILPGAFSQKL
ncbi:Uncharacterised protein [Acinetobacter baumannii]|nr:Uncharacterised protein [Acinetobacter baumannii]